MPSRSRRHTRRRRSHRGGVKITWDVKQRPDGKWAVTLNGIDMSDRAGPYASEKEARDKILEVEGLRGLMEFANENQAADALVRMKKGGALQIKKDDDGKWYIYEDGKKQPLPFDSFAAAKAYSDGVKNPFKSAAEVKEESETKSAASALTQMKGARRTRRHRRRHH